MVTLEQVRGKADPSTFPRHVLDGCQTGLVLFAAGFHGAQDAVWLAEAGIQATCVDTDGERLGEMMVAYPEGWEYVCGNVFEYARDVQCGTRTWDVVTVDCPTNEFTRCAANGVLWCDLANKVVVLGSRGNTPELDLQEGWHVAERIQRSDYRGGVYWTVIQKDTA